MRSRYLAAVMFSLLTIGLALSADAAALPMAIAADDPHVSYSGRWDRRQANAPRCAWSACTVRLRFRGTALNVAFSGGRDIAFQVLVDGKPTSVVQFVEGQSLYSAVSGLAPGEHTVDLVRRTEAFSGVAQFKGFQVATGTKLLPPAKITRRIEFLGDSITAGYGNESNDRNQHYTAQTQNAALAWGSVAARMLGADLMCEAVSGIWLMDTGNNNPLPKRWERIFPDDPSSTWDFSAWQADAVVVNLGTNDGNKPIDEAKWQEAYRAFITSIRSRYPKAHIFLCIGAMGHGPNGCIAAYNERLAAAYAKAGDKQVHALALANQREEDGIGADWHPSVKTHQKMADAIVAAVKKELGW